MLIENWSAVVWISNKEIEIIGEIMKLFSMFSSALNSKSSPKT
jgi:hypothetical protein